MATNSFDDNAPSLSTSIPSENHSNAHLTDTDFGLTAPAAPEDGAPENLEGGRPVYPDNTSSGSNIVLGRRLLPGQHRRSHPFQRARSVQTAPTA